MARSVSKSPVEIGGRVEGVVTGAWGRESELSGREGGVI